MASCYKVVLHANGKHGELTFYFADYKLIQPSLDITCCRSETKLKYEKGLINRHESILGELVVTEVGKVECIHSDRVIMTQPEHL
jgi:hypothetical protein